MSSPTLYLIDGYAQIFRAYYAIRSGMHSPHTGEPTHAVFGFAAMLLKLLHQYQPAWLAVALDAPGKTFRDELYPAYKATREATPGDLIVQIPRIRELIAGFGIPIVEQSGYEADDVLATVTSRVLADPALAALQVCIVSRDKDLEQLIGPRVAMLDVHQDLVVDAAALWEAKGIRPDQVIDMLTLMGDTSDNVPGVDGVGPKTAAQLLREFGSLDNLLANLDRVKGKRRENIARAVPHLPLSKRLVTLDHDAPLAFDLEAARVGPPDVDALLRLCDQLGFQRFREEIKRLGGDAGARDPFASPAPPEPNGAPAVATPATAPAAQMGYRCITTREGLVELARNLAGAPLVAVDTETTGLSRDAELVGLSFAWAPGAAAYVPLLSPEPDQHLDPALSLGVLAPVLENRHVAKCGHNLKFDAAILRRRGIRLRGIVCDSMLASILIDPSAQAHKLEALAREHLNWEMIPITDLIRQPVQASLFEEFDEPGPTSMQAVPLDRITTYAAEDADVALRLAAVLGGRLDELGMGPLMREVEAPLTAVLAEMEQVGILCEPAELRRQGQGLSNRVEELRHAIFAVVGHPFTLDSTRQLGTVLFDELGLAAGRRTKTGRSTDISVLEKLAGEEDVNDARTSVPRLVIEYRQLTKLISTYLGNLAEAVDPRDGRIHTTFHQLVTATGRLASHGPNLQNIPVRTEVGRQIRRAFVAPPDGVLLAADYSQVELRLLAHLSGDRGLIDAFLSGADIHTAVAAQVFGVAPDQVTREQRGHAKTINFGIIYGVTSYGLARRIPGLTNEAAADLITGYKRRFPGIARFLAECVHQADAHGFVATILGRRRAIPELRSTNGNTRGLGERLAINSVVQGSAADLIKVAMVRLQERIERENLPLRMLLQIHDELIFETPRDHADAMAHLVRHEMEHAMDLAVPLSAECGVGRDWLEAK